MDTGRLNPCFLALSESRELASAVGRSAGLELASLEERRFEGGEFKLRPLESVRGRMAFVLQSLAGTAEAPVSDRFLRLLFLLHGLHDAGATQRVALVPYMAFARKDRRTQPRDPVNTRYVAQLLEASRLDHLIALDVHNPAALDNSFRRPVDHLTALPMMVDHFATRLSNDLAGETLAVVSPDVGGVKRVQIFREQLESRLGGEVELVFVEKRRVDGQVWGGTLVGEVAGRHVIVLDDLCATGGTLIRAAEACRRAGAAAVHVAVTHAPLAEGIERLVSSDQIASVLITDSVGIRSPLSTGKLVTLSVAPLFGEAVRRIIAGKSLAPLLARWPVGADE